MVHLDARYSSHDLICHRIDDVHVISSAVGLNDADFAGSRGGFVERFPANPSGERLPFRVVLRLPVLSTIVTGIPAYFFRKWMRQKFALQRISCRHARATDVKILSGLFVVPCAASGV